VSNDYLLDIDEGFCVDSYDTAWEYVTQKHPTRKFDPVNESRFESYWRGLLAEHPVAFKLAGIDSQRKRARAPPKGSEAGVLSDGADSDDHAAPPSASKRRRVGAGRAGRSESPPASRPLRVREPRSPYDVGGPDPRSIDLDASGVPWVGLVYDDRMEAHPGASESIEHPVRIQTALRELRRSGLLARCRRIPAREAADDELHLAHDPEYVEQVRSGRLASDAAFNRDSATAALLAAGSVVQAAHEVCRGVVRSAVCIVRPPGHHAGPKEEAGFCFLNNVAVAAKTAVFKGWARRVLIVDWDVHHGDGTQEILGRAPGDDSIHFFSVHQYGDLFYPYLDRGGKVNQRGVANVAWPEEGGAGDAEYLEAFRTVLLPMAEAFQPDLVLVSAGFDAADGECQGYGNCEVTPQGFGRLARLLLGLAGGRVVLALEGGYTPRLLAQSLGKCVAAMLEPLPLAADGGRAVQHQRLPDRFQRVIDDAKAKQAGFLLPPLPGDAAAAGKERGRVRGRGAGAALGCSVRPAGVQSAEVAEVGTAGQAVAAAGASGPISGEGGLPGELGSQEGAQGSGPASEVIRLGSGSAGSMELGADSLAPQGGTWEAMPAQTGDLDADSKEWGVKAGRGKQVRAEVCVGETSGAFEVKGQIQIQMFPEADSFEIFRW
jgi:histone deacetylase 6